MENYSEEVVNQIKSLAKSVSDVEELKSCLEFLKALRMSYGKTALLLSGGGALGLYHFGVLKCLGEQNLLPKIISGSSAGSICASIICTKTDEEFREYLAREDKPLDLLEIREPNVNLSLLETLRRKIKRLYSQGSVFDTEILKECMRGNVGDFTFLEAYNRTRRVLNITVSSNSLYEMPKMLNYMTAPNVVRIDFEFEAYLECYLCIFGDSSNVQVSATNGQGSKREYCSLASNRSRNQSLDRWISRKVGHYSFNFK